MSLSSFFFAELIIVLAERRVMPVFWVISSRVRSCWCRILTRFCSEGDNCWMASSISCHCSMCSKGASAVSCDAVSGMTSNEQIFCNRCRRHTLTQRFLVARMTRDSVLSPTCQPRCSRRTYTSCTTSLASSSFRKKSIATRNIRGRILMRVCSNSCCVICYNIERRCEMSSVDCGFLFACWKFPLLPTDIPQNSVVVRRPIFTIIVKE